MLSYAHVALLKQGSEQLNVELTEDQIAQIAIYLEELQRWAKIVDLVSQSDPTIIIRKHLLDSLAVVRHLPGSGHLLDLGSGAGFPGMPIAIAKATLSVSLLESRRKRVNFLKEIVRKAALVNVRVYEGRAEEFAAMENWRSAYDFVITRATWSIGEFLKIATPFLAKNGFFIAMKGATAEQELKNEETWLLQQDYTVQQKIFYELPFGKERRSLIVLSHT